MKTIDISSLAIADVMANLFGIFLVLTTLLLGMVRVEFSKQIDLQKSAKAQEHNLQAPGLNDMTLTISKEGVFSFSGGKSAIRNVSDVDEVNKILSEVHPAVLILRIDRLVPTGVTQQVMDFCQSLGIKVFWNLEQTGSYGFYQRMRQGLAKIRNSLVERTEDLLGRTYAC